MTEEQFRIVVLEQKLTETVAITRHRSSGLTHKVWAASMRRYRAEHIEPIQALRRERRSQMMQGNSRGKRDGPRYVLRKTVLAHAIRESCSMTEVASTLGTSVHVLRRNLLYHGLVKSRAKTQRVFRPDTQTLQILSMLRLQIPTTGPQDYFETLYLALGGVLKWIWHLQRDAQRCDHYIQAGHVHRKHLCWSLNRGELLVSLELLRLQIPHVRQFCFYKRYTADLALPEKKILVEIDGGQHWFEHIKRNDQEKDRQAQELGYRVLRFDRDEADTKPEKVAQEILRQSSLSLPSV